MLPQISEIYEFQGAEEFDCKAEGHHPLESRVRLGNDRYGYPASAPTSPLAPRQAAAAGSPGSPAAADTKGDGAPTMGTDRDEPIALTSVLLLGNEFGRCELPEVLFRVRRYDLMTDETRELFVKELRLALQLPSPNVYRKFAGAWLDGVHGLLL